MVLPQKHSTYYYVSLSTTNSASKTPTIITTKEFTYNDGETVAFNSTFINRYRDISKGDVINITSDRPISLMAEYTFTDGDRTAIITYPIMPTSAWTSDYVIPSYPTSGSGKTQLMVVGLNDSTSVRFEGYETGSMVHSVDYKDILIYQRSIDISSTSAVSNHPVAIFSWITTGDVAYSRDKNAVGRSLAMQVPPLDKTAVYFIVPSLTGSLHYGSSIHGYKVRIYAYSQNAYVEIHKPSAHTQLVHVYNKIYYEFTAKYSSDVYEIVSDSPLVVVQIALNSNNMPLFMTSIPAVSQFMNSYKVKFPYVSSLTRSIVIIVPNTEASGLLINGKPNIHNIESVRNSSFSFICKNVKVMYES